MKKERSNGRKEGRKERKMWFYILFFLVLVTIAFVLLMYFCSSFSFLAFALVLSYKYPFERS